MDPKGGALISFLLVPALMFGAATFVVFFGSGSAAACTVGAAAPIGVSTIPANAAVGAFDREQIVNAAIIVNAALAVGLAPAAQTLGVQAAMGESDLRVLDSGDSAGPDSRGLFQQRDNGAWGTYEDRMNPTTSATNFFDALTRVNGWESLDPSVAINSVQHNSNPGHYIAFRPAAVALITYLSQLTSAAGSERGTTRDASECDVSGDAQVLAERLVDAIGDGTLTFLEDRYADQVRAIAGSSVTAKCGLDVRTLQIITIALQTFTRVGISDLNRQCTGSLLGAGSGSSHWIDGGGKAVDFYSLAGLPVTGGDPRSLQLLTVLDQVVPTGTRAGQIGCRPATTLQHITQFTDSCNHLHIDVAYTDQPLTFS